MLSRWSSWGSFTLLLIGLLGCGRTDGLISVTGVVTFNGEPVEEGAISLMPIDGKGVTAGGVISSGRFHIAASPGKASVLIYGNKKELKPNPTPQEIEWGMTHSSKQFLPAEYNDQSKLRIDISETQRHFDFSLNDKGEIPVGMTGN
ncbi:hypothetical protein M4951_03975 [Blastopirellula sp. J2-11]|uniref:hypothetical protein n=1 Tax=Blastopirellula sp. J2-11 TaxID=2943192 RepID=UPI0021C880F4|nr:hypothetical protein [Blastopirellula sp. J2-11]UUO07473.1 hypothetical protein M4951_03975 [Blastopirellula sp. J2-11]